MKYQRGGNFLRKLRRRGRRLLKKAVESKQGQALLKKARKTINTDKVKKIRRKIDDRLKQNKVVRKIYGNTENLVKREINQAIEGKGFGKLKGEKKVKLMMVGRRRK